MSKIDTSSWKKFKISELFGNAKLGKYHNPADLHPDPDGYDFICASNLNNGINKDMPKVNGEQLSLTPSNIIAWGKQCPMFAYHKNPCVTSQGMYYIELPEIVTEEMALFIITLLEHACSGNYGYNNCLIGSKFDELEISLPVTTQEAPDWDYMQERIAELEQERIAELEQYLVAAGLNDYTLTEDDRHAMIPKSMMQFRMGDLFEKQELKCRLPDMDKRRDTSTIFGGEYIIPLVNAKHGDNGVQYYGRQGEWDTVDKSICIVSNGAIATGDVYPEPQTTGVLWDAYLVKCKHDDVSDELLMYFAGAIEKAIKLVFDWGNKAVWNKVQHEFVQLPIQTDESGVPVIDESKAYHPDGYVPDWEYMAAYIRAMEKLVIRDVVDYKDKFIRQHRMAVTGSGV